MSRAVLATVLFAGCSFTPGISHESPGAPDAAMPMPVTGADAAPASPDAGGTVIANTCHSQLAGIRLCLDFEDNHHLSADSSGLAHSVQVQNVSSTTRGNQRAAQLGSTSSITVSDSPDLDIAGPLTMEMWVSPASNYGTSDPYLVSSLNQYGLWISNGQLYCGVAASDGSQALVQSSSSVPTGHWSHVACVYDGSKLKLYIDGSGTDCTQQAMTIATQQRDGVKLGLALQGGLDDVHLYGAALSDSDVCQLATGGTSCTPASCGH